MCDEEGEPCEDYEPGNFTDSNIVLQAVRGVLASIKEMDSSEFPDESHRLDLLVNWTALLPLISKAADKRLPILFQLG
jgi:hypothetical protein